MMSVCKGFVENRKQLKVEKQRSSRVQQGLQISLHTSTQPDIKTVTSPHRYMHYCNYNNIHSPKSASCTGKHQPGWEHQVQNTTDYE